MEQISQNLSPCKEYDGPRNQKGYGIVSAFGSQCVAHRLAYTNAHGPIPEGLLVRHKCDNPPCVNVDHLELGTYADNMRDAVERGRIGKLSAAAVVEIRREPLTTSDSVLGARYGVHRRTISLARTGVTWKNVGEPCQMGSAE